MKIEIKPVIQQYTNWEYYQNFPLEYFWAKEY